MSRLQGSDAVLVEHAGDILVITLNRPDRLNAIDAAMQTELVRVFSSIDVDESNAVVVTGAGRGFCAGGDVKSMRGRRVTGSHRPAQVRSAGRRLVDAMLNVEKPMVAAVNGAAVGLGATIALLCDVVIMSEDAVIGDRHVNVGLVAGDGGPLLWPLLVGPMRAKELLMTGRLLKGAEAAAAGLVSRSVPAERVLDDAMTSATELAALPPYAVRATKSVVNRYMQWMAHEVIDVALAYEQISKASDDHQEALAARDEKRTPKFTGM
jgi:enoyl-CoA hydratase